MRQTIDNTQNNGRMEFRQERTRRSRNRSVTSALLFAVAIGFVAFSTWYSSGSISATAHISETIWTEDQGTALSHPTGGIVSEILVREGQKVKAGDTLLVLDGGNITAPTDGAVVGLKTLAPGELVRPGAKVLAIVPMAVLALET